MTASINYKRFKLETDLGLMRNNIDILLVGLSSTNHHERWKWNFPNENKNVSFMTII